MKINYIYIGCDQYGLNGLLETINGPYAQYFELKGIVTTDKEYNRLFLDFAKHINIPIWTESLTSPEAIKWLKDCKSDWAFMLEYPYKIPNNALSSFKKGLLNFHPSDLPKLRGGAPLQGLILNNFPLIFSCHKVTNNFDKGPICKKSEPIFIEGIHQEDLYHFCSCNVKKILRNVMQDITHNKIKFIDQSEENNSYLWYKDLNRILTIDWSKNSVIDITNKINASHRNYGIKTKIIKKKNHEDVTLFKAFYRLTTPLLSPGCLIKTLGNHYIIQGIDGEIIAQLTF